MNNWNGILNYCRRDLQLEWKDKSVLTSSFIYLVTIVFICIHAFEIVEPDTWNALFWIVLLFTILTITSRSFDAESNQGFGYHFHLVPPQLIIGAKLLLNGFYSIILACIAFLVFSIFLGNDIQSSGSFFLVLVLGASGIGFTFTLTSCLSTRANGNLVLTSVLSLPIILPMLIVIVQLTETCFSRNSLQENWPSYLALLALNSIIVVLSSLLFPYLWRD